jgi:hypothetical protein
MDAITRLTAYPQARSNSRLQASVHSYARLHLRQPDGRGLDVEVHRRLTAAEVPAYTASVPADERRHVRPGTDTQRWLTRADALAAASRAAHLVFPTAHLTAPGVPVSFVLDPVQVVLVLTGTDIACATLVDGWGQGGYRWALEHGLDDLAATLGPVAGRR